MPQLQILPAPQRLLWDELAALPEGFILYGGTAIALQLGHRESIDFDFFAFKPFETLALLHEVNFLVGAQIVQQAKNTLTCRVNRDGIVYVSFFCVPRLKQILPPLRGDGGVPIASLLDLAGMKAAVVQQRPEAKDYIDLDAIMQSGIDLPTALAAAQAIYGDSFNPQITLKALSYFEEGDLGLVSLPIKQRILAAVDRVDLMALPRLRAFTP